MPTVMTVLFTISPDPFAPDMRDGLNSASSTPLDGDPFTLLVPGRKMKSGAELWITLDRLRKGVELKSSDEG
jgi:hypothetical protein